MKYRVELDASQTYDLQLLLSELGRTQDALRALQSELQTSVMELLEENYPDPKIAPGAKITIEKELGGVVLVVDDGKETIQRRPEPEPDEG